MQRTGLFDRDVCLKLAWCGLWDEVLLALEITHPYRLASCTSGESNRKVLRRQLGDGTVLEQAMSQLQDMVAATPVIPDSLTATVREDYILKDLEGIPAVDGGEALLTAIVLAAQEPTTLISGDKRFFNALRKERPQVWEAVESRLLSLERCLLAVIQVRGAAFVIERVRPVAACDSTLALALGSGPECQEASFIEALISFDPLKQAKGATSDSR